MLQQPDQDKRSGSEAASLEAARPAKLSQSDRLERSFSRLDRVVERLGKVTFRQDLPEQAQVVDLIFRANGLEAVPRTRSAFSGLSTVTIQDAAHVFGARTRQIVLPANWWEKDHGNLAGLMIEAAESDGTAPEEQSAVALIRRRSGGYDLVAPGNPEPIKVTEKIARQLKPIAFEIHPSLPQNISSPLSLAWFILPSIRSELIGAAIFGGLIAALGTLVPIATAVVVDTLIPGLERNMLSQLGVALAVIAVLNYLLSVTRQRLVLRANGKSKQLFASAIWNTLLALPVSFFNTHSSGDLQARYHGLLSLREMCVSIVLNSLVTIIFSGFYFALMYFYSPQLAFIALGYVIILVAASISLGLYLRRDHLKIAELSGWLSGYVFQVFTGIAKLRASASEVRFLARWADKFASSQAAILRTQHRSGQFAGFLELYAGFGLIALFSASILGSSSQSSAGTFIAFLAAFGSFQFAFQGLATLALDLVALQPEWKRGQIILQTEPEVGHQAAKPKKLKGSIELSSVRFGYLEGLEVIKGVSFKIEASEHVAIVGSSGSGKSTVMRLMLGLEKPFSGTITFDNQDISKLDLPLLRRQIGVVTQNGKVHAGTILDNIRGATNIDHERCLEACLAAGLESDLKAFPMGLHTPLTEGGSSLSGGQRQRVLIARALVLNPAILFLDEATSALDNRTQAVVTESLEKLNITRIVIAHRLSTIRNADRIFLMDDGRIKANGSFEELLETSPLFQKMAKRQTV